jgi:predicted transglutaminase-like cysteine proteinase
MAQLKREGHSFMVRVVLAVSRVAVPLTLAFACFVNFSGTADAIELYAAVKASTQSPPIGWMQFCQTYAGKCDTKPLPPRDVVLSAKAWDDLNRVNLWANHNIKPETDMDHYGMIQWWRYPDDGAGACHSYALLKRRILMQAGWPRQALLMTIVHEANEEGHAVLTVKTDRGEFILDNLTDDVMLWSKTPYRYYKRQSQNDPNVWVWLTSSRLPRRDDRKRTRCRSVTPGLRDFGSGSRAAPTMPAGARTVCPQL